MNNTIKLRSMLAALVLAAGSCLNAGTIAMSPAGDWDLLIRGDYFGSAILHFDPDGSIVGYQITGKLKKPTPDFDVSRTGTITTSAPSTTDTNAAQRLLGGASVSGAWALDPTDSSGKKILGFFTGVSSQGTTEGTNSTVKYFTNAVSFSGTVQGANGLKLAGGSDFGRYTYSGRRLTSTDTSILGSWIANGERDGQPFVEFFTLTEDPTLPFNFFAFVAQGPDYLYGGQALLSNQGQLSIATSNGNSTNEVIRTLTGSINPSKGKLLLRGSQTPDQKIIYRATKLQP